MHNMTSKDEKGRSKNYYTGYDYTRWLLFDIPRCCSNNFLVIRSSMDDDWEFEIMMQRSEKNSDNVSKVNHHIFFKQSGLIRASIQN